MIKKIFFGLVVSIGLVAQLSAVELNTKQKESLKFMYQEEKVARDI